MMDVTEKHVERNIDMRIDSASIWVTVKNGTAVLEGQVSTYEKKNLAEIYALGVAGIDYVINNLKVVTNRYDDRSIAGYVERSISSYDVLDSIRIKIDVQDGKVPISGIVPTYTARKKVMDIAFKTPGVVAVESKIQVESKTGLNKMLQFVSNN